jgi:RNA polymerase sigma factor (sigma-70 family)
VRVAGHFVPDGGALLTNSFMTFPTTRWTLLAEATLSGDRQGREALDELCRRYRGPILAFFRSRTGSLEDAQDLTQMLFQQLLRAEAWQRADIAKGRFRSYLLGMSANALRNWVRARRTAKRSGGATVQSLDLLQESGWEALAPDDTAALSFDREWARATLAAAWRRIEDDAATSPKRSARLAVLRRFLPGTEAAPSYQAAADRLEVSVDTLKTLIYRMRDDFSSALRAEVAATLADGADLDAEMDHLREIMSAGYTTNQRPGSTILKHRPPLGS